MFGSLQCPRLRNTVVVAVACTLMALSQSSNMDTFWQGHQEGTWTLALAIPKR